MLCVLSIFIRLFSSLCYCYLLCFSQQTGIKGFFILFYFILSRKTSLSRFFYMGYSYVLECFPIWQLCVELIWLWMLMFMVLQWIISHVATCILLNFLRGCVCLLNLVSMVLFWFLLPINGLIFPSVCLGKGRKREEIICFMWFFLLVFHEMEILHQLGLIDVLFLMGWGFVSLGFKWWKLKDLFGSGREIFLVFRDRKSECYTWKSSC